MASARTQEQDLEILSRRAQQVQRGAARAAVLGVNDGLVSVLCVILGVAGAGASHKTVLLAGFAALVAGAISMAAGEWISVKSQVELFEGVLKDIRRMHTHDKALLVSQLENDFRQSMTPATASKAANDIGKNDEHLFTSFVNNIIGINPDELGSPWTAALTSFLLFTAGAITALLPWFFGGGGVAITASIVLTALGGLLVGGYIGKSSGNNVVRSSIRQLLIIILASVVTYGVGKLFGVAGL